MRLYLAKGIPKLKTISYEPCTLLAYKVDWQDTNGDNIANFTNVIIHGITNYTIKAVKMFPENDLARIEFVALFPFIKVYANYHINSTQLVLPKKPLRYKISAQFKNIEAIVMLDGKYFDHSKYNEEYFLLKDVVVLLNYNETRVNFHDIKHLLNNSDLDKFTSIWPLIEERMYLTAPISIVDDIFIYAQTLYRNFPTRLLFPK